MTLARAVGRNTIIQFVGKIVGTVFGFATSILILRYLHPEGNGAYTTAMAYLGFFSVLADLGLYLILVRDLNKPNAQPERVVGNLVALRWVSAVTVLLIGALIVPFFHFDHREQVAIFIGVASFVAVGASQLLAGVFQSRMATVYVTVGELAGRITLLALTWLAIKFNGSLYSIMGAVVGGSLINLVILWWSVQRFVRIKLYFDWAYWASTLRDTLPIAASIVLNLIYFRADTIILRLMKGAYDVGLYGAAYKILEILNTFPIIFVGLLLPTLAAAFAEHNTDTFRRVFQKGFELLTVAVAPLLIGGWLLAEPLLVLIGRQEYAPAAPVLRLLLLAVGALYLGSLSGHVVTIINRQRQMVWSYLSVAVVGLILYLTLIPRYSLYGAALGTVITETLTAIVGYVLITRVMGFRLLMGSLPRVVVSAASMGLFIFFLRDVNFWLALIGGAVVYVGLLFVTRILSWQLIRELIARPSVSVGSLPE